MMRKTTKGNRTLNCGFIWKNLLASTLLLSASVSAQWQTVLTIEAEEFVTPSTGNSITGAWLLATGGCITDWVRFHPEASEVQITITAKGNNIGRFWPTMAFSFDQRCEVFTLVDSLDWKKYIFVLLAPPGDRQIGVWYVRENDEATELYIDKVEIAIPAGTATEFWPLHIPEPSFMTEPDIPATDAEVLVLVDANIENHRKTDIWIRVTDSTGTPIIGKPVRFEMVEHDFLWGAFAQFEVNPHHSETEMSYRDAFSKLFNFGVVNVYWRTLEKERDQPNYQNIDLYLSLCKEHGIPVKTHPLIWGAGLGIPNWFNASDRGNALKRLENRVKREVSYLNNQIMIHDVVNEPLHTLYWERWAGSGHIESALNWARESDPQSTLLVNEYELVENPAVCGNFFLRMKNLKEKGAPLDGLGIKLHSTTGKWNTPLEIWRGFERLAQLGLELHLTEFSVRTGGGMTIKGGPYNGQPWTDDLQAEYYAQVMKIVFGHPSMAAFTFWGFWDGRVWQPGVGLLDKNFQLKPAGVAYKQLTQETWSTDTTMTTADDGTASYRGFYGQYQVTSGDQVGILNVTPGNSGTAGNPLEVILRISPPTGVSESPTGLPEKFELLQNFPNPFNPETTIRYSVAIQSHVQIKIYNTVGRLIRTLVNEQKTGAEHSVVWDGRDELGESLASGVYIYSLRVAGQVLRRKLVLLR